MGKITFFADDDKKGCHHCLKEYDETTEGVSWRFLGAVSFIVSFMVVPFWDIVIGLPFASMRGNTQYNPIEQIISHSPWFYLAVFLSVSFLVNLCLCSYYYAFYTLDGKWHIHKTSPLKKLGLEKGRFKGWISSFDGGRIDKTNFSAHWIIHGKILRILDHGFLVRLLRIKGDKILGIPENETNCLNWQFSLSHPYWQLRLKYDNPVSTGFSISASLEEALRIVNTFPDPSDYIRHLEGIKDNYPRLVKAVRAVHRHTAGTRTKRPSPSLQRARGLLELILKKFGGMVPEGSEEEAERCLGALLAELEKDKAPETMTVDESAE